MNPSAPFIAVTARTGTDATVAIQTALDEAAERGGVVRLDAGVYEISTLRVPSHVALIGEPTWSYRRSGGAILRLVDETAECALLLEQVQGVHIEGLSLESAVPSRAHGILLRNAEQGWPRETENAVRIEHCRVNGFGGDGIHLEKAWAFSIRFCMISHNQRHGIRLAGCDGFLLDNWLSGNGGCGFATESWNGSNTFTGNRIEWNGKAGVHIRGGFAYQFSNNYVDRNGGPGILLEPWLPYRPYNEYFSFTGNIIYRNGRNAPPDATAAESCQVRLDAVRGLSFVGNTLMMGQDDKQTGNHTPRYGLTLRDLDEAVIACNNLFKAATHSLFYDEGGHGPHVVFRDNPGRTAAAE